jgi:hypothetical protein
MVVPVAPVQERVRELTGTRAEHVWLSAGSAWHIFDDHAERGLTAEDIAAVVEVMLTGKSRLGRDARKALVCVGEAGGRKWRVAAKFLDEEAYLTSVTPKSEAP